MSDVYTAKDKQYGFSEQAVFGTAVADAAAVVLVDTEHFNIDPNIKYRVRDNAVATRNQTDGDVVVDTKGSAPTFTSANLAKRAELAYFLYAHFQTVIIVPRSQTLEEQNPYGLLKVINSTTEIILEIK